jgi:hypothetical protein
MAKPPNFPRFKNDSRTWSRNTIVAGSRAIQHLDEAGDRGEACVVVRSDDATQAPARGSGDDDLAARSTTCRCCRLGSAWRTPECDGCGRKKKRRKREREWERDEAWREEDRQIEAIRLRHGWQTTVDSPCG